MHGKTSSLSQHQQALFLRVQPRERLISAWSGEERRGEERDEKYCT